MDRREEQADRAREERCASCGTPTARADAVVCQICKRYVCRRCIAVYGHHMLACEECRLAPW